MRKAKGREQAVQMMSLLEEESRSDSDKTMNERRTRSTLMEEDPKDKEEPKKAKHGFKTFRRLFTYTWQNKWLLIIANVGLLISSGCLVLLPLLSGQMVDTIRQGGDLSDGAIKFAILTVFQCVFSAIRGYGFNLLGEKIIVLMRHDLFSKLLQKDIAYYDKNKSGELLSRLTSDIATVNSVCSDNLSQLIRNILQFFGSLFFLWLLAWKLTLMIIITTPVISFVLLFFMRYIKKVNKEYSNVASKGHALSAEVFANIRVVRSFSNQQYEAENYLQMLERTYDVGKKKNVAYGFILLIMTFFGNALILIILYFGGKMVIDQELSIGDLTSFVLYTITLTIGFASISGIINQTISAIGICEKLFEIMDEPIEVKPGDKKPDLESQGHPIIEFKNAKFSYPSKTTVEVLKDVSFSIKMGQSVAIVGPSGSGKSSIVNLLLRFYDLNSGSIEINGTNIRQIQPGQLRQQIGFVSQEPTLFSGNLSENIEYGLTDQKNRDEIVSDALQAANAKEFVYNPDLFPQQLRTLVGQRGVKLSGGQKQRIAIARCLAKNPRIMIFDEATSALDAESEYQVQRAIDKLVEKKERTMVIVAHRLSTIINCDRILVLKYGQIVESGSHKQLLAQKRVYAALVERQLSNFSE